jgi:hypothetical protein
MLLHYRHSSHSIFCDTLSTYFCYTLWSIKMGKRSLRARNVLSEVLELLKTCSYCHYLSRFTVLHNSFDKMFIYSRYNSNTNIKARHFILLPEVTDITYLCTNILLNTNSAFITSKLWSLIRNTVCCFRESGGKGKFRNKLRAHCGHKGPILTQLTLYIATD